MLAHQMISLSEGLCQSPLGIDYLDPIWTNGFRRLRRILPLTEASSAKSKSCAAFIDPANDLARDRFDNHGQIQPAFVGADVVISAPGKIGRLTLQMTILGGS